MSAPLLSLRGVSVRLPKGADREFALQDVDLDVAAGRSSASSARAAPASR
ncbi:hypothetical protein [Paeniroseomonas aquatica]